MTPTLSVPPKKLPMTWQSLAHPQLFASGVALELAVPKQRFDGIASSVPVQEQSDFLLGSGDDGSVSHDGPFWFRPAPLVGLAAWGAPVPEGVSGGGLLCWTSGIGRGGAL